METKENLTESMVFLLKKNNQIITKKGNIEQKKVHNGRPMYDISEPWAQQYIEDFGTEPGFF